MTDYIITNFNKELGRITVQKGTVIREIELPIENGNYIQGDVLDSYIDGFFPPDLMQHRIATIKMGVNNEADIAALVSSVDPLTQPPVEPVIQNISNIQMWNGINFEQQVVQILLKHNIIQEDPTIIPVSTL